MNKLMARIVAVVMAIAMLGTVSFAANYASATGEITTGIADDTNDAMETVLVYATNTPGVAYADGDVIVAIKQGADVSGTINVDQTKVANADKDYLTIALGGTDGQVAYTSIDIRGTVDVAAVTVKNEIELDGITYTNVAYATFTETVKGTVSEYGIKFNSYESAAATEPKADADEAVLKKVLDEPTVMDGTVTFGAVIMGVPYDTFTAGTVIKATPYVVYAQ